MLYEKTSYIDYKKEFDLKFKNFTEKAPVLLSFVITEDCVIVKHENSGTNYKFKWDYQKPLKSFIYEIKQILVEKHYPKLIKSIKEIVDLTTDERASFIENGGDVYSVPTQKEIIEEQLYVIDKVIVYKDIFIIREMITGKTYRYKMNRSSVFFLKHYRSGAFKSLEEAGDFFFKHSELLNEIVTKEE